MWKCFHRGVWETIDRGVTVFKADTSNGTCLISSLAKDLDGKNEEFTRNKNQICSEDRSEIYPVSRERNVNNEHGARRQIVNRRAVKIHHHDTSKGICRGLRYLRARREPRIIDKSLTASVSEDVRPHCDRHPPPGVINSCTGRTLSGKCELQCSCDRSPSPDSDYISESQLVDERRLPYRDVSRESGIQWKLYSHPLSKNTKNVGSSEQRKESYSPSSKQRETCLIKGNFSSLFRKVTSLQGDGQDAKEEKFDSPKKYDQADDFVHSNTKPNCLLELPFLCYDPGRFKGLRNVSTFWLAKPSSEFGRGDGGRADGEQNGESEEAKEEAWRECQMHHSFMEAIRWSSAVLLGWFLGQCRFWPMHGELRGDSTSENKSKYCVIRSLSKLLVTWRGDTALPLKVLPSKGDDLSKDYGKKKDSEVQGSDTTLTNETYSEFPLHPLLVSGSEENNLYESHSSSNYLILQKADDTSHKRHLKQNLNATSEEQKSNVIPLPWHADSEQNLIYGPITLEEAVKEAGKELDEAQAEVLLALALEKLNKGGSSAQKDPLPADLFQSAASFGSVAAAFNLGICFEKGVGGVAKDLVQAYHWYKQASEQGHAAATYNLAVFHANGLGGLHPDTSLANELLLKASSLGLEEATNALGLISSFNLSEASCSNEECSSLNRHAHLGQGNGESSNSHRTREISKSHSPAGGKSEEDSKSVCSEPYFRGNGDLSLVSIGAVSQPSGCFKETSKITSLKIDHLLVSHGIAFNDSAETDGPLLEEMMFDDKSMKHRAACSNSVQLLAH